MAANQFIGLRLRPGDRIEFSAEVMPYIKGYLGDNLRVAMEAPSPSIDWQVGDVEEARIIQYGPVARMLADGSIWP